MKYLIFLTNDLHLSIASMVLVSDLIGNLGSSELLHLPGPGGHQHQDPVVLPPVQDKTVRLIEGGNREWNLTECPVEISLIKYQL